jgi:serine/threonine-protein kinase
MATVYLAHDVKHERKVALKVLRPELAAVIGAERFLAEIKVTANLQHPHILPLHDSGEADTFLYYVMPYVEGETLRDKIDREKQLGVEEAVEITRSVAAALDYAHRQNVIHRDIKPENILLHDGQALVADFGIALALSHAGGARLTETGLSIGTPHYMSPEQAMGDRELDARSDVYSLGAMLYEMLAGDPPYTGSTAQAIVAKVITEKAPSVTVHRDTVPAHVAASIEKSLAKLPADRFHSAAEFAEALGNVGFGATAASTVAPAEAAAKQSRRLLGQRVLWPALAALLAAAALIGWIRQPEPPPTLRLTVSLPGWTATPFGPSFVLSPDGSALVYRMAQADGSVSWVVRRLGVLDEVPLNGMEDGLGPVFSPDGTQLAFANDNQLRRVSLVGGPSLTITDSVVSPAGWGEDGWVYFTHANLGIARVRADGGPAEQITTIDSANGEGGHIWGDALPSGRGVLFSVIRVTRQLGEESDIAVVDLETREVKLLVQGSYARYAASGHIVYARSDGALLAVPFDDRRLEVTGPPVAIAEGVPVKTFGDAELTLSRNGTLVYAQGIGELGLAVVDPDGREILYPSSAPRMQYPRVSPDGRRVAVEVPVGGGDIWIYELSDSTISRLSFEGGAIYPEWMPDGRSVSYSRPAAGTTDRDLFYRAADGSGAEEVLAELPLSQIEGVWHPDGRSVIIRQGDRARAQNSSFIVLQPGTDAEPTVLLETPFLERAPVISPDGRWLAYVSDESGRDEVYVRPFPGPGGRWQVSSAGGTEPRWAHSGRELFYRTGTDLVAVTVRTTPTFATGQREALFPASAYQVNPNHSAYDVLPDDRGFVFVRNVGGNQSVIMVLNWFPELERVGTQ